MDSWLARARSSHRSRSANGPSARRTSSTPARRSLTVSGRTSRPPPAPRAPRPAPATSARPRTGRRRRRPAARRRRPLLLRQPPARIDPGKTSCSPSTSPTRSASGRSAWPVSSTAQQLALVDDHRLGPDGHQGAQALDLLALGHQRLGSLLQHLGLPLGQVEAVGQVGHHPADRAGADALGLLHGLDQRSRAAECSRRICPMVSWR